DIILLHKAYLPWAGDMKSFPRYPSCNLVYSIINGHRTVLLHPLDHDFGISVPLLQRFRLPVASSFQQQGLPVLIMETPYQPLHDAQIIALLTFSRRIHAALDFSLPHNACPFPQRSSIISSRWSSDMVPIFTYSLPGPAYKGRKSSDSRIL